MFAPNISAVDTAERDHLRNRLEIERQERAKVRKWLYNHVCFFPPLILQTHSKQVEIDRARLQKRIYELERMVSAMKQNMEVLSNQRKPSVCALGAHKNSRNPHAGVSMKKMTERQTKPLSESNGNNRSITREGYKKKTPSRCNVAVAPTSSASSCEANQVARTDSHLSLSRTKDGP